VAGLVVWQVLHKHTTWRVLHGACGLGVCGNFHHGPRRLQWNELAQGAPGSITIWLDL
jgi:hypothetical protein